MKGILILIAILCSFIAFGQKVFNKTDIQPIPMSAQPTHTVYLIGDAGDEIEDQSGVDALKYMLRQDPNSTVIFLGDNIYPHGLHGKKHEMRAEDEARILHQLDAVKDHKGRVVFIPGNHDWEQGGPDGRKMVKRQQKYIEEYLDNEDAFMPDKACPGPDIIELGDLSIIVIDTQWWLHPHERSVGEADGCQVLDPAAFMVQFREALKKNRNKHTLIVGHHPLRSNGEHGGRFPLKQHLFPLTSINDGLYIPLPVLGSIYPLYRGLLGDRQDIQHPVHTEMANSILQAMNEYENMVYACGHEHNLQYFQEKDNHLVVSGSGSKITHVGNSSDLLFGAEKKGFARLNYYEDGRVWLEYMTPADNGSSEVLFSQLLYTDPPIEVLGTNDERPSYKGMTASVVGDSTYHATGTGQVFMGRLNRELWLRPIEVPYLDIHYEKGGLTPIKMGGGMQSKSIRLQGGDGHQYVVRQIKKNATFLVSKSLRNTFAQELIYDGIAGSHPYASIVIPHLSDPLGIYHSNPELVFLPDDPILGDLREDFGGTFCLFEERPHKDMSHESSFGNSEKVMSYGDMIGKVHGKKKHRVDEEFVLRNRLFDMLIGDWDRHDDQWRWARFKEDELTFYRPIPRDRDQAFFKFDGLLPNITNREWVMRKFQKFGPDIRDIRGQNFNARYFDRSWLTQMDREDWQAQAQFIRSNLSDQHIEEAIALFPDTAKNWNGEFLIESLKARREILPEIAERYYKVLAESVKIVGKLGNDVFEVVRLEDGRVEVKVSPEKDKVADEEFTFYHRIFEPQDTKEIILYGLDGKDRYLISGTSNKKSILVRIVGGEEKDYVSDTSKAPGLGKKTRYYDDDDKNETESSGELKTILTSQKNAIQYDRKDFVYDTYMPLPYVGANPDDGFYLGAGITWTNFGFNKMPYKNIQMVRGNYAFKTGAFNFEYRGHFVKAIGPFDFRLTANTNRPFVFQYNGAGNETEEVDLANSRTRLDRIQVRPALGISSKSGSSSFSFGVHADNWRFEEEDDEFSIPITNDTFLGGGIAYSYVNVDNRIAPHRGIRFNAMIDHSFGVEDPTGDSTSFAVSDPAFAASTDIEFTKIESELSLYLPLGWMPLKTTLALRTGIKHNEGDFNFYQAAFIGGQQEFRGVRRNRYAGNTAQYNNAELRFDLKQIQNHTLPFRMGVMGHYDLARVWLDGEGSDIWHSSVGGGIYFDILGFLTLNGTYSVSDDGEAILVQGGFFF